LAVSVRPRGTSRWEFAGPRRPPRRGPAAGAPGPLLRGPHRRSRSL